MNIVVCIKQVPASSDVKIDPVTGVLIRDGNITKMNPYDLLLKLFQWDQVLQKPF